MHQVQLVPLTVGLACWVPSSCWHGEQRGGRGSLEEAIRVRGARLRMSPSQNCPSLGTACRLLV